MVVGYNEIVAELSRVASAGEGDRSCIFHISHVPCFMMNFFEQENVDEFLTKFQQLTNHVFDKCGKSEFRQKWAPKIAHVAALAGETENCGQRMAQQMIPMVQPATSLPDGLCAAKSYSHKSIVIFKARTSGSANPPHANERFERFANEINILGGKMPSSECELKDAGKMPCDLLEFPKREIACQLAARAERLYRYLTERCSKNWTTSFGEIIEDLKISSQPGDGAVCPSIGENAPAKAVSGMNKAFFDEYGVTLTQSLRDTTAEHSAKLKEERTERRRVKIKRESRRREKFAKLVERETIKRERKNKEKAARFEEKRAQQAAERFEHARLEFERRQAEYQRILDPNYKPEMLLDAVEIEEFKEPEEIEDIEEFEHFDKTELCEFTSHQTMKNRAVAKFERTLAREMSQFRQSRVIRASFEKRMKMRFSSVLEYLTETAPGCTFTTRCFDFEAVFGEMRVGVENLVGNATKLVGELENQCQVQTFTEYFLTMSGRATRML